MLADWFDDPDRLRTRTYSWDVVGLVGWALLFNLRESFAIRAFLPVLILPTIITVFRGKVSGWVFRRSVLTTLGGMCYSLYLLHPLLMTLGNRLVQRIAFASDTATFLLRTAIVLAVVFTGGIIFFVLVERPCMNKRWPQDLLRWLRSFRKEANRQISHA